MALKLVDASEAADMLALGRRELYAATRAGLVPCVRIGRRVRYDADALEEWAREGGQGLARGWRR